MLTIARAERAAARIVALTIVATIVLRVLDANAAARQAPARSRATKFTEVANSSCPERRPIGGAALAARYLYR
jgi:hypothetical protein